MKNKTMRILIISIIGVAVLFGGISYAYLRSTKVADNPEVVTTLTCLDITFKDTYQDVQGNTTQNGAINLTNVFPIRDEDGLVTTPHSFTVTNNCNTYVIVDINLESLYIATNGLDKKYIKAAINYVDGDKNIVTLTSNNETEATIENATSNKLMTFTLTKGESRNFELRLWVDYATTVSQGSGKTYQGNIVVIASPSVTLSLMPKIYDEAKEGTLLAGIRSNYARPTSTLTTPGQEVSISKEAVLASTKDDYGTSYYFRGAVENNYVVFADMCWRIVRIDGLGNIKLVLYNYMKEAERTEVNAENNDNPCASVYDGNNNAFARYSGTTYTSAFNSSHGSNAYVGLMYGSTATSATYEETHANTNKSTILTNLETWYDNNLASYESKLADVIWCNDKSLASKQLAGQTGFDNTGNGTAQTWYGATERLVSESSLTASSTASPTLVCPDASTSDDNYKNISKFTVYKDIYGGNGALDKKIGLLTADEIAFAGSCFGTSCVNRSYYLYKNASSNSWWSASPFRYDGFAYEWVVYSTGFLSTDSVHYT